MVIRIIDRNNNEYILNNKNIIRMHEQNNNMMSIHTHKDSFYVNGSLDDVLKMVKLKRGHLIKTERAYLVKSKLSGLTIYRSKSRSGVLKIDDVVLELGNDENYYLQFKPTDGQLNLLRKLVRQAISKTKVKYSK